MRKSNFKAAVEALGYGMRIASAHYIYKDALSRFLSGLA